MHNNKAKSYKPSIVTLDRIDASINFRPKYQIVPDFERHFSRHIPEVWSIPYTYGTLVIWIKRHYWPDSRSTNDEQRRARYPKNVLERALCYYFFPKSITRKEYHLQILVQNIKNWQSYDFFMWRHVISCKSTFFTQSRMFKACSVIFDPRRTDSFLTIIFLNWLRRIDPVWLPWNCPVGWQRRVNLLGLAPTMRWLKILKKFRNNLYSLSHSFFAKIYFFNFSSFLHFYWVYYRL